MALVDCNECGNQVSNAALTCPNCGIEIAKKRESVAAGAQLQTTQDTSKKLKLHSLFSIVLFIIGAVWLFVPGPDPAAPASGYALLLLTIGLLWYLITRFRIWWHHK